MKDDPDNNSTKRSNVHRALIFQGEDLSVHMKQEHTKPSARNYQFFLESNKIEKKRRTGNISYRFQKHQLVQ
jgi:hypothetical protein